MLIAFIVACVAASKLKQASNSTTQNDAGFGTAAQFCGIWTVLLLILISVTGTIIMRRVSTLPLLLFQLSLIVASVSNLSGYWIFPGCYFRDDSADVDPFRHVH